METIFSKIIKGEIPSYKIFEDSDHFAFLDINPENSGHFLVIPKKHSTNLIDIKEAQIGPLFSTAIALAKAMIKPLNANSFKLRVASGKEAGQMVFHTHVHIIPFYDDKNKQIDKDDLKLIHATMIKK